MRFGRTLAGGAAGSDCPWREENNVRVEKRDAVLARDFRKIPWCDPRKLKEESKLSRNRRSASGEGRFSHDGVFAPTAGITQQAKSSFLAGAFNGLFFEF